MDNSKEYIMAAALRRKIPKTSIITLSNNDIYSIEIGFRHCDIRDRFLNEVDMSPKSQGFYTSKGRFVTREEAKQIAIACGQLNKDLIGGQLTSEDLW